MKKWILFAAVATCTFALADGDCAPGESCCSECIVEGRIPKDNMRFMTFVKALDLIKERNLEVLVETGTSRSGIEWCASDGCSTILFSDFLEDFSGVLYSIDCDPNAIAMAKKALQEEESEGEVIFIQGDSIKSLEDFDRPIDFLYLDSYDLEIHNPAPSQAHHLKEIEAAYPWLHDQSVVMIDDCDFPHQGKGKLVIEFLLEKDWKILVSGYQVILVRN